MSKWVDADKLAELAKHPRMTAKKMLVFLELVKRSEGDQVCFSYRAIGESAEISPNTALLAVKFLKELAVIHRVSERNRNSVWAIGSGYVSHGQ